VENTLAYYDMTTMAAVKCFIVQVQRGLKLMTNMFYVKMRLMVRKYTFFLQNSKAVPRHRA
jgi:hypothetical protein